MERHTRRSSLTTRRGRVARLTVSAIAVGSLAFGFAGCATLPGESGDDVVLELWDTDTRPERTANLKELITMFEEENPGITIKYLGLPTDSYIQKISTAIATNSTPDLLTPKASDVSALVAQDALEPLDERFDEGEWGDKIAGSMVESSKAAAPDGKLYLTPATSLADVIYYRSDWFAEAGLAEPKTWDDFYAATTALTKKDEGRFGYTIRGGTGFFPQFVEMVYTQAGVDTFFLPDGTSTLDDPAIIEAAEKYAALYNTVTAQSDLTADFKAMVAQFGAGSAGILSHSIGSYPDHVKALGAENVMGIQAFPSEANGKTILSGRMTTGFAMFKSSEHKDAAWKFLEYTMGAEGNSFWAQASGYLPGNLEVAKEDWVVGNQPMQAAIVALDNPDAVVLEQPYYLPQFNSITGTDMLPKWQQVLQGELSAKDFLTEAAASLTEAQQAYLASSK